MLSISHHHKRILFFRYRPISLSFLFFFIYIFLSQSYVILKIYIVININIVDDIIRYSLIKIYSRQPHGEETLRLSLPAPELELGTPPRLCYPLVIFLTRRDTGDPHPDETVDIF